MWHSSSRGVLAVERGGPTQRAVQDPTESLRAKRVRVHKRLMTPHFHRITHRPAGGSGGGRRPDGLPPRLRAPPQRSGTCRQTTEIESAKVLKRFRNVGNPICKSAHCRANAIRLLIQSHSRRVATTGSTRDSNGRSPIPRCARSSTPCLAPRCRSHFPKQGNVTPTQLSLPPSARTPSLARPRLRRPLMGPCSWHG